MYILKCITIFTIYLYSADGTRLENDDKKTWDEYNQKCEGHLSFSNDTIKGKWTGSTSNSPSARFWVGHRVWSYVLFGKRLIIRH